jgi:hypothetical protein
MSLPHEDRDFADLVAVVARRRRLAPALVEKDYWVTHVLWGLHQPSPAGASAGWTSW